MFITDGSNHESQGHMKNHVVLMVIFPIGWPKTVLWLYPYSKDFIHTLLVFPQTLSHGFPLTLTTSMANSLFHFHTVIIIDHRKIQLRNVL